MILRKKNSCKRLSEEKIACSANEKKKTLVHRCKPTKMLRTKQKNILQCIEKGKKYPAHQVS